MAMDNDQAMVSVYKAVPLENVRNIGIMAHIDAGKTTTSERILFYTGKTHKIGETHDGASAMDFNEQEQKRGITIYSAATTCIWKDIRINLIDTPGHVDFTAEVERSLRVLDGAVCVLDGKNGVEPQTETVWRQADKYDVPRIVFVNKLDATGADYEMAVSSVKERVGANGVAIAYPVGIENRLLGLIDLVEMKAWLWDVDPKKSERMQPNIVELDEVPSEFSNDVEQAHIYRQMLIEALANNDDAIMEKVLMEEEPTVEEIKAAIRKQTITRQLFPCIPVSAYKNKGVQYLLDAVKAYLPSPVDVPAPIGHDAEGNEVQLTQDPKGPFVALAFKLTTDQFGTLCFFRIYSGSVKSGSYIYNVRKGAKERVSRLELINADSHENITEAKAGEIVAAVGFSSTRTGDTLVGENDPRISLESIKFQEPVISEAIEPLKKGDQDKMASTLIKFTEEDPTFHYYTDQETGQGIIAGVGELQLEVNVTRLKNDFGISVKVGAPQVAYRETVKGTADCEGKYIKQSGGHGQYGEVEILFEPTKDYSQSYTFKEKVFGGAVPKAYFPAVEKGLIESVKEGVIGHYPVLGIQATLLDGSYHSVDSSEQAFKTATMMCFKEAMKHLDPCLLEPYVILNIYIDEEYLGDLMSHVNKKRGKVLETDSLDDGLIKLVCRIPQVEILEFAIDLRSITQGQGLYDYHFDGYEIVNDDLVERLLKK